MYQLNVTSLDLMTQNKTGSGESTFARQTETSAATFTIWGTH